VTARISELADGLMRDASGLQRRADALLETIETMMPTGISTGMARSLPSTTSRLRRALQKRRRVRSTPPPCAYNCSAR